MGEYVTGTTFGGGPWTPAYVTDLNQATCIGCGRCYKVCPRDVFDLVQKSAAAPADDDDFDDDDDNMVMRIKDAMDCIGCQACAKVCPKNCLSHQHKLAA